MQTNRRIDNTGPVVAITNPIAGRIRGVVSLDGTATDPAGVSLVTFEYRQGAGAWQLICSDPTASYTCGTIDTTRRRRRRLRRAHVGDRHARAPDDLADHRRSSSTTPAPTATNVQAANGGTAGRIDAGDTVTFTWSEPMAPVSILAGWNGASTPIRVRVQQRAGATDTLDLYNAAGTTRLNVMSRDAGAAAAGRLGVGHRELQRDDDDDRQQRRRSRSAR